MPQIQINRLKALNRAGVGKFGIPRAQEENFDRRTCIQKPAAWQIALPRMFAELPLKAGDGSLFCKTGIPRIRLLISVM